MALFGFGILMPALSHAAAGPLNVWWPTSGSHMTGVQPFKAQLSGLDVSQYQMFWQVDGGQLNPMSDNSADYPHKEASVDVTGWSWHGSGPYQVNFVAKDGSGNVIAQQEEDIYVDNGLPAMQVAVSAPAPAQVAAPAPSSDQDPAHVQQMQALKQAVDSGADTDPVHAAQVSAYFGTQTQTQTQSSSQSQTQSQTQIQTQTQTQTSFAVNVSAPTISVSASGLYVNPGSEAATQEVAWANNPADAAAMQLLASEPTATWFGNWNSNVENDVHTLVSAAAAKAQTPVLVAYNIPERDCGGFSAGGADNPAGYANWISQFAEGLGSSPAIVILEPDALAQISCLSQADQQTRLNLLFQAVHAIKQDDGSAKVYLDAGHSGWVNPGTMGQELEQAGISAANGFALNVSNFDSTSVEESYGQQISQAAGGAHFIVDTSRNGNGSDGQWCNPQDAAIGETPTMQTGNPLVDAFLWVKTPGESDGSCNGGPPAGQWWPQYALSLVQNAH